jgi:hypothetical protein
MSTLIKNTRLCVVHVNKIVQKIMPTVVVLNCFFTAMSTDHKSDKQAWRRYCLVFNINIDGNTGNCSAVAITYQDNQGKTKPIQFLVFYF